METWRTAKIERLRNDKIEHNQIATHFSKLLISSRTFFFEDILYLHFYTLIYNEFFTVMLADCSVLLTIVTDERIRLPNG